MIVRELVEILQKLPQERAVYVLVADFPNDSYDEVEPCVYLLPDQQELLGEEEGEPRVLIQF